MCPGAPAVIPFRATISQPSISGLTRRHQQHRRRVPSILCAALYNDSQSGSGSSGTATRVNVDVDCVREEEDTDVENRDWLGVLEPLVERVATALRQLCGVRGGDLVGENLRVFKNIFVEQLILRSVGI